MIILFPKCTLLIVIILTHYFLKTLIKEDGTNLFFMLKGFANDTDYMNNHNSEKEREWVNLKNLRGESTTV